MDSKCGSWWLHWGFQCISHPSLESLILLCGTRGEEVGDAEHKGADFRQRCTSNALGWLSWDGATLGVVGCCHLPFQCRISYTTEVSFTGEIQKNLLMFASKQLRNIDQWMRVFECDLQVPEKMSYREITCCVSLWPCCIHNNTLMWQRGIWDNSFKLTVYRIKTELLHLLHWCKLRVMQLSEFRAIIVHFAVVPDTHFPVSTAQTLDLESLSVWTQTWFIKPSNKFFLLFSINFSY